jgi:hypothetical protein
LHNVNHSQQQAFRFIGIDQYRLQVEAFARVATGNDGNIYSLENSQRNQRLIDSIYRAGKTGQLETL